MASTAKNFSLLLLLLLTLLSSLHVHARESQFFSKVPKETTQVVPNKEQAVPLTNNQEKEPTFIPQTEEAAAYGLYGHESSQLPPTTTTTTTDTAKVADTATATTTDNLNSQNYLPHNYNKYAYVTEPQGMSDTTYTEKGYSNNFYNGDNSMYNSQKQQGLGESRYTERGYTNNYNDNTYNSQKQGLGEARYTEKGYTNNNYYNGDSNLYNSQKQQGLGEARYTERGYNTGGNMYNNGKQGMSDTRFLENGRYYYNPESERYNSVNAIENSRGFESRKEYNNKGYYGNSESLYDNNSMEGFQNPEDFQQNQDERFMP